MPQAQAVVWGFSFLPVEIHDRDGHQLCLRPQTPGDFFGLMSMYGRFDPKGSAYGLPPKGRWEAARWLRRLERESFNLVAVHDRRIVGHAILAGLGSGRSAEMTLFVDKTFRDRGLGTALASVALRCALAADCELLWTLIQRYNRPAIQICRKAGFTAAQAAPGPDVEMRLRLARLT
ncbi:MAG: GNAT family N-acetyltransferase [Pseudomonadota bacterium]